MSISGSCQHISTSPIVTPVRSQGFEPHTRLALKEGGIPGLRGFAPSPWANVLRPFRAVCYANHERDPPSIRVQCKYKIANLLVRCVIFGDLGAEGTSILCAQ
jgi:hypothetical protein